MRTRPRPQCKSSTVSQKLHILQLEFFLTSAIAEKGKSAAAAAAVASPIKLGGESVRTNPDFRRLPQEEKNQDRLQLLRVATGFTSSNVFFIIHESNICQ
jgi:hypothetical protein